MPSRTAADCAFPELFALAAKTGVMVRPRWLRAMAVAGLSSRPRPFGVIFIFFLHSAEVLCTLGILVKTKK